MDYRQKIDLTGVMSELIAENLLYDNTSGKKSQFFQAIANIGFLKDKITFILENDLLSMRLEQKFELLKEAYEKRKIEIPKRQVKPAEFLSFEHFLVFDYKGNHKTDCISKEELFLYLNQGRADELSSFAILGIDLKISPDNEVKIIEVNGSDMGMKGFAASCAEYNDKGEEYLTDRLKPSQLEEFASDELIFNPAKRFLCSHLLSIGLSPLVYINWKLRSSGIYSNHLKSAIVYSLEKTDLFSEEEKFSILMDLLRGMPVSEFLAKEFASFGEKYNDIADLFLKTERILEVKRLTDLFFRNIRDVKQRTYQFTSKGFSELVESENPEYVVIKPNCGYHGKDIRIIEPRKAKATSVIVFDKSFVAESFVESKPILSLKDGRYHDGCMRYAAVAEKEKNGNIKIYHFGGYWRLCPKSFSNNADLDAMTANLARGAFPQRASDKDLDLIRKTIDEKIPIFYRDLLSVISS